MMTLDTSMMLAMFWFAALPLMVTVATAFAAYHEKNAIDRMTLGFVSSLGLFLFLGCVAIGIDIGYPGTVIVR